MGSKPYIDKEEGSAVWHSQAYIFIPSIASIGTIFIHTTASSNGDQHKYYENNPFFCFHNYLLKSS